MVSKHVSIDLWEMHDRGKLVEKAVRESGIPLKTVAERLGKSRQWMYNLFGKAQIPIETMLSIGKVISYDFSSEIKELQQYRMDTDLIIDQQAEYWKNKYIALLEEHNRLLLELSNRESGK